jgi:hypothetical protein
VNEPLDTAKVYESAKRGQVGDYALTSIPWMQASQDIFWRPIGLGRPLGEDKAILQAIYFDQPDSQRCANVACQFYNPLAGLLAEGHLIQVGRWYKALQTVPVNQQSAPVGARDPETEQLTLIQGELCRLPSMIHI